MAKVRFNLRPNKNKSNHIQLVYRIDSDRKKLVIGTGLHVDERFWNKSTMRVRETKDFIEFEMYNAILDKWELSVNEVWNNYMLQSKIPSRLEMKRDVINNLKGVSKNQTSSFIKYFEKVIENKKLSSVTNDTVLIYENALNHVNRFRRKVMRNADLEFQDLDRTFFLKFINYLKSEKLENSTINKNIKKIRAVLNDALTQGIDVNLDYKLQECQVGYVKQPKLYLNDSEIEAIEDLKLKPDSKLDRVRDLFLIGLFTGLRYSDFSRVSQDHVREHESGIDIIRIKTKKTNAFVSIPLKKKVKEIINKYEGKPPKFSQQKFNDYLKELCKKAEIKTIVSRDEDGKQVNYEKWKLVSSHICRRSFATNSFKAGVPPKLVMNITGHTTIKQFMEYISIDEEETVALASQNAFFN